MKNAASHTPVSASLAFDCWRVAAAAVLGFACWGLLLDVQASEPETRTLTIQFDRAQGPMNPRVGLLLFRGRTLQLVLRIQANDPGIGHQLLSVLVAHDIVKAGIAPEVETEQFREPLIQLPHHI